MTADRPRNLPASVHDRLLSLARESHRPFNELLQYFAMERFLFRMGRSRHAARFVLKGGLMLLAWRALLSRPTTYPGKAEQWRSYLKRNSIEGALSDFAEVTNYIRTFLRPIATALAKESSFQRQWKAPGPWRRSI